MPANLSSKIYLQKFAKLVEIGAMEFGDGETWARISSRPHDMSVQVLLQDWKTESSSCWGTVPSLGIFWLKRALLGSMYHGFEGPVPIGALCSGLPVNRDLSWVCITAQLHPLHNPCPSLPQLCPKALLINVLLANFHSRFHFPGNSTAKGSDQVTFREDML